MNKNINNLLAQVEKPLRYIDHEINTFHKDFNAYNIKFCFIYPDTYELGISHLGIKILYSIINKQVDAMADRAYTPWPDFGDKLLAENIPLYAIESKRALKDFDCLCFTLQTELIYTNILYTLELAQINLRNTQRNNDDPIIMAGGINAINPQPLSLFIDAFFIGEAEEGIIEIKNIFKQEKSRQKRLERLAKLDYMYLPEYSKDITIHAAKYMSFTKSEDTHFPQIVPLLEGTHNRYTAEIMRGCSRGCRFCQAGMFYRPVREKNPDIIIKQLISDIQNSGWDQASLMSLSSSDYTCIKPLLTELINTLSGTGTSLSLPSLRIDNLDLNLAELLNQIKKTGITLAPEAGTQRLRDVINKNLTEDDILNAIKFAFDAGAKLVKLYFMIGLPYEEDEDIEGIITLVENIIAFTNKKMRINVSISPFVPKPGTPFQWAKMNDEESVLKKALKIKHSLLKYKFIKISYHTIELSFLEAVLCRGDKDTAFVLESAYKDGAKFDAWREFFDYDIWTNAAKKLNYNWYKPINGFEIDSPLPWDNINIGVTKNFLKQELLKAQQAVTTPDCKTNVITNQNKHNCKACGACNTDNYVMLADKKTIISNDIQQPFIPMIKSQTDNTHPEIPQNLNIQSNYLYRIFYSKLNDLKYFTHLDFLRLVHRFLMLSNLKVTFSQGFNPHPKTAFCPPLSSGIEGENEFFDIWLSEYVDENILIKELQRFKIRDLEFTKAILCYKDKEYFKNYIPISAFDTELLNINFNNSYPIEMYISQYITNINFTFTKVRKGKEKQVNLKDIIYSIEPLENNTLQIIKKINGASVFDILKFIFNIERHSTGNIDICRKELLCSE
jgi:radical SAM family uncharacterized protein/radical SAM-linked protein